MKPATLVDLARAASPLAKRKARRRSDAIGRAGKSMGMALVYRPAKSEAEDAEFGVFIHGKETAWTVQVGHGYACLNKWIEAEQAMQSWDYKTVEEAFETLPGLMRTEGF